MWKQQSLAEPLSRPIVRLPSIPNLESASVNNLHTLITNIKIFKVVEPHLIDAHTIDTLKFTKTDELIAKSPHRTIYRGFDND